MIIIGVFIFIILHMTLFWGVYRWLKNPSVVDVGWASVLTCSGWIYWYYGRLSWVSTLTCLLLLAWGLRLGGYLYLTRIGKGHQDKRYTKLSEGWKMAKSLGFFINFQVQGFLALFISLSFYFISQRTFLVWFDCIGMGLIIAGLIGESLADYQLQWFKRFGTEPVCRIGLWQYMRHPNYFFDWLTWTGFAVIATSAPWGWFAWISPLLLYWIMVYVTGPMTESGSLASRGQAYRDYQSTTNLFFPTIKRFFNH